MSSAPFPLIVHSDEAGSTVPGSLEASVFLSGALIVPNDGGFQSLVDDLKSHWSSGVLRKDAKAKRASDQELDAFTDLLCKHDVQPSICYLRHPPPGFAAGFKGKSRELNEKALSVLNRSGVNAEYTPPDGHRETVMIWSYVSSMAIGTGLGALAAGGTAFGKIEIHVDDLTLKTQIRDLFTKQLKKFVSTTMLEQVLASLSKLGLSGKHVAAKPTDVTLDFKGTYPGRYLADYLCSIAFRALETFDLSRHNPKWIKQLEMQYGPHVMQDVTAALISPLPPIRV